MSSPSTISRVLGAIWRGLDRVRRVLHLILLLGFFLFLFLLALPQRPLVPDSAALLLAPEGALVDQLSGDPFERALARAQGLSLQETLLKDLIDAVRAAASDQRIKALVLELDGLGSSGLSKLQELAAELDGFKESGKPIIAVGSSFDRNQYYLAAHADQIFLHPMGLVLVDGYSTYIPYYKSALDKLYIDYNVWTVGEYKSFVEPVERDDMSPADREARSRYLGAMWDFYKEDIAATRELDTGGLQRYADSFVELLRGAGGDTAQLALDYGLVDEVLTFDLARARIREIVGPDGDEEEGYSGINHADYLASVRATELPEITDSKVAVIVASGTILDGRQPPGTIGGDSMAELIRAVRADETNRALVLRVDSPGGSAFASDVILRELDVFRESGRPLVVSMGSVAASGGYWIAMSADEIWASPTTLTGSIGVGATFPTFQRTLAQVGVNVDGVGTTELSGQMDPLQGIGEDIRDYIGLSVQHTYDEFVGKVAEHRELDPAEVERSAQGRVWIGSDAEDRGLVDRLGGLEQAIASAAELAGLAEGSYAVDYVEPALTLTDRLLLELMQTFSPVVSAIGLEPRIPAAIARLMAIAEEPLRFAQQMNDPRGIYAYCFCDVR